MIRSNLSNRTSGLYEVYNKVSKTVTKVCPQSSVLGPTLWNLIFDGLMIDLCKIDGVVPIAYADDLFALKLAQNRREIEKIASKVAEVVTSWRSKNKMKLSRAKTDAILLKGHMIRKPASKIQGSTINASKEHKYLGTWITEGLLSYKQTAEAGYKCRTAFNALRSYTRTEWDLKDRTLATICKGLAVPILTYKAPGWAKKLTASQ